MISQRVSEKQFMGALYVLHYYSNPLIIFILYQYVHNYGASQKHI